MKVLYFAWLRQHVGAAEETVEPPADVSTAGALMDWLSSRSPGHAAAFQERATVRVAIDQDFAELDAPIAGAQEIAFFPPVTGG